MKFKQDHMRLQLEKSPKKLQELAGYLDEISFQDYRKEIIITRVWDSFPNESGVHPDKRAFDVRVEYKNADGNTAWYYTPDQAEALVGIINRVFPRKDKFKTALYHCASQSTYHIHVQIPVEWANG